MVFSKIKQSTQFQKLQALYKKYERFSLPVFLLLGVINDALTFRFINLRTAFILLSVYIVVAGFSIAFVNYYDNSDLEHRTIYWSYVRLYIPLIIEFVLGNLLSASLIFYWFNGSFSASWPLILVIVVLMVSSNVFRKFFVKLQVQLGLYFFILFSLFILFFSFKLNSISVWVFMFAGFASLFAITLYVYALSRFIPVIKNKKLQLVAIILFIFGSMNFLYFQGIIPPIPLSLREAGIYHNVERTPEGYKLTSEKESFFDKILPGQTVNVMDGERLYVFTSIFAPAELNTTIVHHWQYNNGEEWVDRGKSSFAIAGGREEGYRGYSYRTNLLPGKWRVLVETPRGQLLGKVNFRVEVSIEDKELIEEVK